MHFLWIDRPRLTFFYVHSGTVLEHAPSSVFLIFRTVDPLGPDNNRLTLDCSGQERPQAITPSFNFESGPLVTGRVYTYELPLQEFAMFATCSQAGLRVGRIPAAFSQGQLEALRDFASHMRPGSGPH
jgi:hypothetical protein